MRAEQIVQQGESAYLENGLLQEAGDSLMMKLGEAAKRISSMKAPPPSSVEWEVAVANRNFLIHQYDESNRAVTWMTLSDDLPAWHTLLQPSFEKARTVLTADSDESD
ncbi:MULTISPECIES: HepT-like ribonuclease domain-containing protein [unclassified Brevibacterium]|uniref:HepT-like ribonuclease domain-containing protein n=1 Tax=unclassified Brevibacterium TaxID=2614124 RepID=UPI00143D2CEF|nr:HepT-like ribonuclease domain-containing protein [Brevibacterium sp. S22]